MSRKTVLVLGSLLCVVLARSAHGLWRLAGAMALAGAVVGLTLTAWGQPDFYEYARARHQPISVNSLSVITDQPSRFLTQAVEFSGRVIGAVRNDSVVTVILKLDSGEMVHLRTRPQHPLVPVGEQALVVARLAEPPAETYVFDLLAMKPAAEARLRIDAAVSGLTMTVSGAANLPDGTRLTYVVSAGAPTIQGLLTKGPKMVDRRAVVQVRDGEWAAPPFDLRGLGAAELGVFVLLERKDLPLGWKVERTEFEPLVAWDTTVVPWAGDPGGEAPQGRQKVVDQAAEAWYQTLVRERRAAEAKEEAARAREKAKEAAAEKAEKAKRAARMALGAVKVVRSWVTFNVIGNPEACIVVLNGTRKTLDAYEVNIYCYDNFNRPVKHYLNGSNCFRGISQDIILAGEYGSLWSDTEMDGSHWVMPDTWTLYGHENTTKIRAAIGKAHFTDNTTWTPGGKGKKVSSVKRRHDRRR